MIKLVDGCVDAELWNGRWRSFSCRHDVQVNVVACLRHRMNIGDFRRAVSDFIGARQRLHREAFELAEDVIVLDIR